MKNRTGEKWRTNKVSCGVVAAGVKRICLSIRILLLGWTVACSQTILAPDSPKARIQFPALLSDSPSSQEGVDLNVSLMAAAADARQVVVRISSEEASDSNQDHEGQMFLEQLFQGPFFRKLFGEEFGEWVESQAKLSVRRPSSGVIVRQDGYILTTSQAVPPGHDLAIHLSDDRIFSGEVLGRDPETDLALIKIQAENLPVLTWGDFSQLKVGQIVLAVGSPPGVNYLATQGIISAFGPAAIDGGSKKLGTFIYTDAFIDVSNSGGALVNLSGELIGINSTTLNSLSGLRGMGFAVPIDVAGRVMSRLIDHENVGHGRLGVSIQDLTQDLATQFGMETAQGILVTRVEDESPASSAGLRRGDIITQFNGEAVNDSEGFRFSVRRAKAGSMVLITIFRDGQSRSFTLTVGESLNEASKKFSKAETEASQPLTGVVVGPVTDTRRDNTSAQEGVVVKSVQADTIAARAGLLEGDIILEVNRNPIHSVNMFQETVKILPVHEPVLLLLERQNSTIFLFLQSVKMKP